MGLSYWFPGGVDKTQRISHLHQYEHLESNINLCPCHVHFSIRFQVSLPNTFTLKAVKMHSTSFLLWLGVCLVNSKPAAAARHKFPYLDLIWTAVDSFNGIYFVDIQVGNPPQTIRLGHDTGSSDIFMHSTADTAYLESCSAQTPNVCFPGCK